MSLSLGLEFMSVCDRRLSCQGFSHGLFPWKSLDYQTETGCQFLWCESSHLANVRPSLLQGREGVRVIGPGSSTPLIDKNFPQ